MGIRRLARRGRAWGNALGGWRQQGRNSKGQFMRKGVRASISRNLYRNQLKGKTRKRDTARAVATSLHQQGFYIAPEAGLGGVGLDAGYGKIVAPKVRASVSVSVKLRYTGGNPVDVARSKIADKVFEKGSNSHSMAKYGVAKGPIEGTAVTFQNGQAKLKYGAAANTATNRNPSFRTSNDKRRAANRAVKLRQAETKRVAQKKARVAKQARSKKTTTNGHITVTQQNRWANKDGSFRNGRLSKAEQARRGRARKRAQQRKKARLV